MCRPLYEERVLEEVATLLAASDSKIWLNSSQQRLVSAVCNLEECGCRPFGDSRLGKVTAGLRGTRVEAT